MVTTLKAQHAIYHSRSRHPTRTVNVPGLFFISATPTGTRFTYPRGIESWADLATCYNAANKTKTCIQKRRIAYNVNMKFELMLTRRAKAYSSSGSVVKLKIGVFTLS